MPSLQGKTALVTGAARGIGRATADALHLEGATVIAFDRSFDDAPTYRHITGSVAEEQDVLALFSSIREREQQLDIVVNCAGIQVIRPLLQTTVAEFNAVVDVNLKGTFLIGREALRMISSGPPGGRVINVASELAYLGRANYSAYCATKGGVISLTRAWAREFAPHVLVNAVAPGPTETAMISLDCMTSEEIRAEVAGIPLGRLAKPQEIAAAIVFLAGPGATYFTGQVIGPNGGTSMA